ncbi:hypothetical protein GCM10027169_35350 [Gordonia jinhuaensis]|uniref:MspA protein n=1 Tax=Gordonia jinhuaensis TaxID=1517702 RepID=A0A916T526_9ACTN|nr:MspA family porin [Gordonia jinhuaensis]GGB30015.1 hypothetical protein GCM10011489_17780 [Gordonia jinhuaensis]
MSKFSKVGLRRVVGASAVAAAAAVGLASMGAGNAAAASLPNGSKVTVGVDGTKIVLKRTGESAYSIPSLESNGAGRTALLSGHYTASAPKGTDVSLSVGVAVGCQVDISGLSSNFGASVNLLALTGNASLGLTAPITPGQAGTASVDGAEAAKGGTATVDVSDYQIYLPTCAGYAQARTFITATVTGNYYVTSTLWGAPFSLT